MKLYYWPTSPYGRKVMVVAKETGLESRLELIHTLPRESGHDLRDHNPLGKIPALIIDDGQVLFDSPVICEYLDSMHGGRPLIPSGGPHRWRALRQQAEADGILDAAVLRRMENLRREENRSKGAIAHQTGAIHRAVTDLNQKVGELTGEITIGQVSIACALGYLDFRSPEDDWRHLAPDLSDWFAGFSERPSMQATVPADPA